MQSDLVGKLAAKLGESRLVECDLVNEVRLLALDEDFPALLPTLHPWLRVQLQDLARRAPGHPEDVLIIRAGICSEGPERDRFLQQELLLYYWTTRRLRELLLPELGPPPFEAIVACGVVKGARVLRESERVLSDAPDRWAAVFGDFSTHLIRDNPVIVRRPDGSEMETRMVGEASVRIPNARRLHHRRYGMHAIFLDGICDPSVVPRGSELFADRSAERDIPPYRPGPQAEAEG